MVAAKQLGVSKDSVRRWVIQSQVGGGRRAGGTSEELAEIKAQRGSRRLRENVDMLRRATTYFAGNSTPQPLIMALSTPCEPRVTRSSRSAGCVSRAAGELLR